MDGEDAQDRASRAPAIRRARDALRLALALAENAPAAVSAVERVDFIAAAADDGGPRRLPERMLSTADPALEIRSRRLEGVLEIELIALGLPAIKTLRRRRARLLSHDLSVDYAFAFSHEGVARLTLSDDPAVDASLAMGLSILLEPAWRPLPASSP